MHEPIDDRSLEERRVRELAAAFSDPNAFRTWYEHAVMQVYRYLFPRCGGDMLLAEELTQQTFIQAIDSRTSFAGRSTSATWLCAIARNKLTDHYRELARINRRHLRLMVREVPASHDQGHDSMVAEVEDRELVLMALRNLPALQRAAVVLCYVDGLTVREAAGILKRSESATESLLTRARERLRESLREVRRG